MNRLSLLTIGCIALLHSCSEGPSTGTNQVDVFDKTAINSLAQGSRELQQKALKQYEEGTLNLRKGNNPYDAIDLLLQSLRNYPTARTYFELGNAYAKAKNYEKAVKSYELAEQLGFAPVANVFYNMACAYSMLEKKEEAKNYLEYAIEAGFVDKNNIINNPDLNNLKDYGLNQALETALSGVNNPENVVWDGFVQNFKRLVLPVTVDINSEKELKESDYMSFSYERYITEMRYRERFSRSTGDLYYAYGLVDENSNYIAVIYAEKPDFEMSAPLPPRYILASYNKKGLLIDKLTICGQKTPEDTFRVCTIHPNLTMQVSLHMNKYKTTADEEGYYKLELESSEPAGTLYYLINESGKFVETGAPLGATDVKATNVNGS